MKTSYANMSALCLAVLATGCAEDSLRMRGDNSGAQMPITLSAAYPSLTRASDAGFEDGDRMGVFVLDYIGNTPQDIAADDTHATNVRFKFNGIDNTWAGATALYWTTSSTPADIIGYYPYSSSVENPSAVPFSIARRQDQPGDENGMGGYEASDFLWAKAQKVMPTDSKVDLTFSHKMAGIRVTLQEGKGFADGEWAKLEKVVLIPGILPNTTINLSNGEVAEASGSRVAVVPYQYNSDWRAVVVPQSVPAGSNVIDISVDGTSYHLIKSEAVDYVSGKLNSFTITVDKRSGNGNYEFKLTDEAITAWLDDVDFRDGIMREYVIINVEKRGGFSGCLDKMNLKNEDILNVKILGEVDEHDFEYIRNNLKHMKSLNLYDCEVYHEGNESIIPPNALEGLEQLNHIVFPKHLTIIGSCAFFGCGLMGDLIIPEGVTHIGTGADLDGAIPGHWGGGAGVFTNCSSLVGSLTLPSTLKFIESGAFCRAPLSGELIIPESVEFIGSIAFDSSNFTGNLIIPTNIQEIGVGAFYRVPFTGNLEIPQGIKIIRNQTFSEGDYTLLSLPDGLIEIGDEAFGGCGIRGELKLPSTLKRIGNRAFENNKFSNIVFPEKINYMGWNCFADNSRLSGTLSIPDGITSINEGCFANCSLLDEVIIGDNITKIEGEAFSQCYNLTSVVINNPEPPLLTQSEWGGWEKRDAFWNVPKDNFTLQVPEKSVDLYSKANGWKEFKRIAAYSNFICRPSTACALKLEHHESLVLNSDGEWEITHCPDWCSISRTNGSGKTELDLTIKELSKGTGNRTDYIEFSLKGTDYTTRCTVSQYDYEYGEDECITLQTASRGNGVDIVFIGDGFDGNAISEGMYLDLVNEQLEAFFGVEPYSTYRDYFNVYACISLSQETGVNTANTWRNTRFNTIYAEGNLVLDDMDAIFDYVVEHTPVSSAKIPSSLVIMTLNSEEYGSSTSLTWNGSAVSICSRSSDPYPMDTRGIVQHEACGHGFGKLAEERIIKNRYVNSLEKTNINSMHDKGWYQNISLTGKINDVNWSELIFDPRYSDKVDVFEGGFGVTRGVYRAEINSCMNYGIPYFSAPARMDIMRRILEYSGEGFTMEKFYATDSDKWGSTGSTRAAMPDQSNAYVNSGMHHPVRIVKSKKY